MRINQGKAVYWTLLEYGQWEMYLAATSEGLCYVGSQQGSFDELENWVKHRLTSYTILEDSNVMQPYKEEVVEYLEGKRKEFTVPIDIRGTAFQQNVWQELQRIPYGQTVSYQFIAEQIQKPNAARAVGAAIGANPVLMAVPCHRVIAKNKKLTGYRGGLAMKEDLLELESYQDSDIKIDGNCKVSSNLIKR